MRCAASSCRVSSTQTRPPQSGSSSTTRSSATWCARTSTGVRNCYNAEFELDRKLEGRVVTRFVILRTGLVGEQMVEGDIDLTGLDACLCAAIKTWKFLRPNGGGGGHVNVTYPFNLIPA